MRAVVWAAGVTGLPSLAGLTAPNPTRREMEGLAFDARVYNMKLDPDERFAGKPRRFDSIMEDASGIQLTRHPEALLLEDPALWGPISAYRRGQIELGPEDEELSAFEQSCKIIIGAAHARKVRRAAK